MMMGVVLIILFIVFVLNRAGERECDDGGKFFGW